METQASVFGRCISKTALFLLILSVLESTIWISTAQANPLIQGWEDHSESHAGLFLEPRFGYYSSSQNYDQSGNVTPLAANGSLSWMNFDLLGTYGFNDRIFAYLRASALYSKASSSLLTGGSASAFGFSDQMAGLAYRIWVSPTGSDVSLQAEGVFPTYSNSNARVQNNPYLGDGSIDISLGAFGNFALPFAEHEYIISVGTAFTKRSYGFSSAIPWGVFFKRDPQEGFYFSIGTRGQLSLQSDDATNNTVLLAQVATDQVRGGAGSYLITPVNPSWALVQASLGFRLSSGHLFYIEGSLPYYGRNSANGFQMTLAAQFDFGRSPANSSAKEDPTSERSKPVKYERNKGFSTYDLISNVTSTNDQAYLLKINKGSGDGVEKGQVFDVFRVEQDSVTQKITEKRIARAKVTYVKSDESALTVLEYFIESWVEVGFEARRLVQ